MPLFTKDARKTLGWAIGEAEAAKGVLRFKRWRAGAVTDVSITLPVMGAYSDTVPYNCPKSAKIMANAAKSLAQRMKDKGWREDQDGREAITALALMATGDPAYMPMVQEYARKLAPANYVAGGSIPYGEHQPFWGEHQIGGQGQERTVDGKTINAYWDNT